MSSWTPVAQCWESDSYWDGDHKSHLVSWESVCIRAALATKTADSLPRFLRHYELAGSYLSVGLLQEWCIRANGGCAPCRAQVMIGSENAAVFSAPISVNERRPGSWIVQIRTITYIVDAPRPIDRWSCVMKTMKLPTLPPPLEKGIEAPGESRTPARFFFAKYAPALLRLWSDLQTNIVCA
jgi:hypothetical protein